MDAAVEMEWPDLIMANETLPRKGNWPCVDEGVFDVDGNPLPQLPALPPPQNDKCPELVSNSSGDASDQDLLEDGHEWYPDEATLENRVLLPTKEKIRDVVNAAQEVARRSTRENKGIPSKRLWLPKLLIWR